MTNRRTKSTRALPAALLLLAAALAPASPARAQEAATAGGGKDVYERLKSVALSGGAAEARGLVLKRDRAEMTFDGTFYFNAPAEGRVTCAVFVGRGRFRAEVPPSEFERENVRRLLGADAVESDFETAVLRFTDDTFDQIGEGRREGVAANPRAEKLAAETDARLLRETGANLPARLALSLLNGERPGFFYAVFDGGRRGRFSLVIDHQNRVPVATFRLNGGEKGLVQHYEDSFHGTETWMAFYALEDYRRGMATYSDVNELIDARHYRIDADLRDPNSRLRIFVRLEARTRAPNLRAVPFSIGESLPEFESRRLKKQMRVKSARVDGERAEAAQEDWEGGLTVFLPRAAAAGQTVVIELALEGDFMRGSPFVRDCFYPASNTDWYPRHGDLDRATYELTFRHPKNRRIAGIGRRLSEEVDPEDKGLMLTRYRMEHPVPFATFAYGPFERHTQMVKWDLGGEPIPAEFNSLPGSHAAIKEDFILAEMDNSLRYFSVLFGKYPYPVFSAAYHPFPFGQGLPGLLMIPAAQRANKYTYAFIAHETAHQWWGDVVSWRSYRDQWLSEGFAEYSGVLYTGLRESMDARDDLVSHMRRTLRRPPATPTGIGKGRLAEVGPIILGHRLNTTRTGGAYGTLIYHKGALVLRMLHFLFTNPAGGDDKPFFDMMTDFVARHRDGYASTDDFRAVAGEHFARTPVARKYGMRDLDWFFSQWVYQTGLPSYKVEYRISEAADGKALVSGDVIQKDVPESWVMPLPLVMSFGDNQWASGTVLARGARTPFEVRLPMRPRKVELDPSHWVLSESTSTEAK